MNSAFLTRYFYSLLLGNVFLAFLNNKDTIQIYFQFLNVFLEFLNCDHHGYRAHVLLFLYSLGLPFNSNNILLVISQYTTLKSKFSILYSAGNRTCKSNY